MKTPSLRVLPCLALLALSWSPAGWAQYKVVAPDGSITYTDRPPVDARLRVVPLGRNAPPASADVALPLELRLVSARYPVTLFTTADCPPCDSGRKLLQRRGVPYSERTIGSEEDALALERLIGARTVPALSVGAQPLRGFSDADWSAYLDAAGYPKEPKLPRNWPAVVPTPLVQRAVAPEPAERTAEPVAPAPLPPAPAPGTIRF